MQDFIQRAATHKVISAIYQSGVSVLSCSVPAQVNLPHPGLFDRAIVERIAAKAPFLNMEIDGDVLHISTKVGVGPACEQPEPEPAREPFVAFVPHEMPWFPPESYTMKRDQPAPEPAPEQSPEEVAPEEVPEVQAPEEVSEEQAAPVTEQPVDEEVAELERQKRIRSVLDDITTAIPENVMYEYETTDSGLVLVVVYPEPHYVDGPSGTITTDTFEVRAASEYMPAFAKDSILLSVCAITSDGPTIVRERQFNRKAVKDFMSNPK